MFFELNLMWRCEEGYDLEKNQFRIIEEDYYKKKL